MSDNDTFMYFGYGSNMLTERIHIHNPTAKFVSVGRLENYRFGFEAPSDTSQYDSTGATIRSGNTNDYVMGCVWEIAADQVSHLDRQEMKYTALEVNVLLTDGSIVKCRTYEMMKETQPGRNKPHPFYKKICIEGARQHDLPKEYIQFLESFEDTQEPRKKGYYEQLVPVLERLDKEKA